MAKKPKVETVQGDGFVLTIRRDKVRADGIINKMAFSRASVTVDMPVIRGAEAAFKTLGEVEGTVPPPAEEQEDPEWEEFIGRVNYG